VRSWDELAAYVRARYEYEEPGDRYMFVVGVDNDGARGMVILAEIRDPVYGLWVEMTAPIGMTGEVDVNAAVQRAGSQPCGGISVGADMVLVRHTIPFESMSELVFEKCRASLMGAAKALAGRS
jgi:hypothetical protein